MRISDIGRSVAANSRSANILDGKAGRIITVPSMVRVMASSAGVDQDMKILLAGGGQLQTAMDDQEVSNSNRYPQLPEDFVTEFPVVPGVGGDELIITLFNRTAGAILTSTVVDITPVG